MTGTGWKWSNTNGKFLIKIKPHNLIGAWMEITTKPSTHNLTKCHNHHA